MSTRTITKGAIVTLRARKNKKGTIESLYLDYYSKNKRVYKFLELYLYVKPKSDGEKESNEKFKKLANELRTQFESDIMGGGYKVETKGSLPFVEYMIKFKEKPKPNGEARGYKTKISYDTVANLLNEKYPGLKLKDITEDWAERFREFLLSSYDQDTARNYMSKVTNTIKGAKKDKLMAVNPFETVNHISPKEPEFEFLSFEELITLKGTGCELVDTKRAALTSAMTGIRAGDLMDMKWNQIVYSEELGNHIRFKQHKNGRLEYLPISESVLEIIGEKGDPDQKVFPEFKNDAKSNTALRIWVLSAGIKKKIRFHSFRHTHAILLGIHGANLFQISKMLGHKTSRATERSYARVLDQTKREVIDKLPKL